MNAHSLRPLIHPRATIQHRAVALALGAEQAAPSGFDYPVQLIRQTLSSSIYVDPALGQAGVDVANYAAERRDGDNATLRQYFGMINVPHMNILIAPLSPGRDGTGGAYHYGCGAAGLDLYCDVRLVPAPDPRLTVALIIAEEVEVWSGVQNAGWDCGGGNGEALSRVLAEEFYTSALDDYATAPDWLSHGRPDWVTRNRTSDQDPLANGCGVLFLYWIHYALGYEWPQICEAAAPTLAGTYQRLGAANDAWTPFITQINRMFPSGAGNLQTDNPFM